MSSYENVTYPVTLVCAGNRRKEQNVVRKSKGFSWGPAGVSTALFTGVVMADVIRKARPTRKARYVCMEGADKLVSYAHQAVPKFDAAALYPGRQLTRSPAEWLLWHVCQAQLGTRPKSRHYARTRHEWRASPTRSRHAITRCDTRPDRWEKREMAEKVDCHRRAK
jgi:hypothetical protein